MKRRYAYFQKDPDYFQISFVTSPMERSVFTMFPSIHWLDERVVVFLFF
jgi:hypothetical protein